MRGRSVIMRGCSVFSSNTWLFRILSLFRSVFSWCNGSSKKLPRKDPVFRKNYFYAKGEDGKAIQEFRKDVYFPLNNPDNIALVHYIGNETLSVPGKHGNSLKQTKLFFRTKPSVMKKISTEVEQKAPHKVYKQMVTENVEAQTVNEATDRPRNVKQIQNIKATTVTAKRLSRDAIMNTHELAYEENGFIWHITTYPDVVIVCGLKEVLDILTETISWNRSGILLSYDTTFCLGEFYVSPRLFRCSVFEEKPVIPAMFLFHERKFQSVHEVLFSIFIEKVKRTAGLPIVVDMEQGIVGAIHGKTSLHIAGCWRHLNQRLCLITVELSVLRKSDKEMAFHFLQNWESSRYMISEISILSSCFPPNAVVLCEKTVFIFWP